MKIGLILEAIKIIVVIVPAIATLVREIEEHKGPGQGAEKKEAIMAFVGVLLDQIGLKVSDLTPALKDAILFVASAIIDGIVAVYNAIGLFKKAK